MKRKDGNPELRPRPRRQKHPGEYNIRVRADRCRERLALAVLGSTHGMKVEVA
jgi:hypothetical protein